MGLGFTAAARHPGLSVVQRVQLRHFRLQACWGAECLVPGLDV